MSLEGALAVRLVVAEGRVAEVDVRSTRRTDVAGLLAGLSPERALTVIPSLFALCGRAHTVAALEACEAALGVEVTKVERDRRRLAVALEALDSHAFAFCVDWPATEGDGPSAPALRRLREATEALRRAALPEAPWLVVGGGVRAKPGAQAAVAVAVETLAAALEPLAPAAALASLDTVDAWARTTEAPGLLRACWEPTTAPEHPPALLPPLPPDWFAEALCRPDFSRLPTLDGEPREAGALALLREHPLVAAALRRGTSSVGVRLLARLLAARALLREVQELTQSLREAPRPAGPTRTDGVGTGVADTARGRLAHQVEIGSGRVLAWRSVAPTEWTFHPAGVLRQSLLGATALDLHHRSTRFVTALDPCVPCSVELVERAHA